MKNRIKKFLFLPTLLIGSLLFAQEEKDSIPLFERYTIFEGDTLMIELDEIFLLKTLKFKTDYDRRYYLWYRKKTLKAYPYAKLAADRLEALNERLGKIKAKRKKKEYIKVIQKYMEGEFTDQLKKLTRTEGEILIKLMHRQTGHTAYDLVKDYRSGWKAFWYNTTANIFKLSLKDKYDPLHNKNDFIIEDVLQRAFTDGILQRQPSKVEFDYYELGTSWIIAPKPTKKKGK